MAAKFGVGATLSESWAVWRRNILPFTFMTLLFTLPLYLIAQASGLSALVSAEVSANQPLPESGSLWLDVLDLLLGVLVYIVISPVVYGTVQNLRGESASFGDCFSKTLAAAFSIAATAIFLFLASLVAMFFLIDLRGERRSFGDYLAKTLTAAFPIAAGAFLYAYTHSELIASLFLIIPGVFLSVIFWLWLPVTIFERPGSFASFNRSVILSEGNRLRLFVLFLISEFFLITASGGGSYLGGILLDYSALAEGQLWFHAVSLIIFAIGCIITSFSAVLLGVTYYRLRLAWEGASIANSMQADDQAAPAFPPCENLHLRSGYSLKTTS